MEIRVGSKCVFSHSVILSLRPSIKK